jgi:pimeloyl-[acyl-carrier protein] methyl ester esterase
MRTSSLRLGDGRQLFLREQGEGTPLLCLHGWSVDGSLFREQIKGLSKDFHVLAPDLPGHGRSEASASDLTIDTLAADMRELIELRALENLVLVGWSLGAMVAWSMLLSGSAPKVTGLISIDMSPSICNRPGWQLGLKDGRDVDTAKKSALALISNWPAAVDKFVPRIFSDITATQSPEIIAETTAIAISSNPAQMAKLWQDMAERDYRQQLAKITTPTFVAYGAQSQLYPPETADYIASAMPHAAVCRFEAAGHAPHLEQPEKFNSITQEFSFRVSGKEELPRSAHA